MTIAPAPLEDWLRERYFTAPIDISSSGVENYTVDEVLGLAGQDASALGGIIFRDSHSLGSAPLRQALAERFGVQPDQVMATQGSSEAIYLTMHALLRPGDEVVVPTIAYHALDRIAAEIGCRLVRWEIRTKEGLVDNLDELLTLIGPSTRMVVLNFPHNPTGATVSAEQQESIVAACAAGGVWLAWDGAFRELVYDAAPLPEPVCRYERAVSFGTLSKAYGLPGLRVGWVLAAPEVLAACVRLRDYLSLALSPLVEAVAVHAVEHASELLGPKLSQAEANRTLLLDWLEAHDGLVQAEPPRGGVTAFPLVKSLDNTTALAQRLEREHGVLVVPGSCFDAPRHLRIGFGGPETELRTGLDRLAELLSGLSH
ncbi:capreomycidine synthase [Peterkaempfera sp. SMS 1(5)a]|uniref:capreomycidine synthase n=1 Tax=Peterkaempfera podocarpi TaxID=3232308 RepID=UPI003672A383